jgi:Zn ribbon nucleic-acid-binding protein
MTGSKRFISGAVCPSCQVVDRIVIESLPGGEGLDELDEQEIRRRCVACGFTEQLDADAPAVSAPLPRARYDRSRRTTDQVEVVKILEPGPSKGSS